MEFIRLARIQYHLDVCYLLQKLFFYVSSLNTRAVLDCPVYVRPVFIFNSGICYGMYSKFNVMFETKNMLKKEIMKKMSYRRSIFINNTITVM